MAGSAPRVARVPVALGDALAGDLGRVCARSGRTIEEVLLAGIAAWLMRYSGQSEFDLRVENRRANGESTAEASRKCLQVRAADDTSFSQLVKTLPAAGVAGLAEADQPLTAASPVCFVADSVVAEQISCDFGFWLQVSKPGPGLTLLYSTQLFENSTAKRFVGQLETLLRHALAEPEAPVSRLPLLPDEEMRQLLEEWNQTAVAMDARQCLHQLVEDQARRTPDATAVEHEAARLSYSAFNARANALARDLRAAGIEAGSHVGICLPSSAEFAVATLAVLKAGCACLPLDPKYPAERLLYMLEDAQAKVVLTRPGLLPASLPGGLKAMELGPLSEPAVMASENLDLPVSPADSAYLIYTSGSTGKPRGVVLAHCGLSNYVFFTARYHALTAGDRVLQFCSLSFDIAVEEMFMAWVAGATVVFRSEQMPLDVPGFLEWIREKRITALDLPTAYWHEWVSQFDELESPVPEGLRLVIVGGEKALAGAYRKWQPLAKNVRWVNTYGPTEASIAVTRYEPQAAKNSLLNIPIGRAVENCRLYVLDRLRQPVPVGAPGELYIGGIGVARGYFNRPEMTAQRFITDPFSTDPEARLYCTGDVVRFLPDGNLEYIGRDDNQVKIRGFRVELGEIEEALSRCPQVREAAVVAVEDAGLGKSLVAYCSATGGATLDIGSLRATLRGQLPEYMVPGAIVAMDELPKTPNGKIDRRGLAQLDPPKPVPAGSQKAPATLREKQLQQIWQETLGRRPIGLDENFFDLGGHSLLAARLMQKISRLVGKTVPLALLFEAPTIEQLVRLLENDEWSSRWSSLVAIQPKGNRPPLFCVHGVGGNVVGFRELGRLLSPDYPLYGFQAQGLDGQRPPLETVEELAAHYIREMRTVQPEGPFLLGGYSFGGMVAYEMAQQLREGGEQVALLALLDTYPGELNPVATSLWRLFLEPARLRDLKTLPRTAKKSIDRRVKGLFLSETLKKVLRTNQAASARYVIQPYEGKSTLFRAEQSSLRAFDDPHAEWGNLAVGGLETLEIGGDHGDILMPPQVVDLATKLKAAIDRASAELAAPAAYEEEALA